MVFNPQFIGDLDYDAECDFVPVIRVGVSPMLLLVHARHPARSVADFISRVRQGRGDLRFGSRGTGFFAHLCGKLLWILAGVGLNRVVHEEIRKALEPGAIARVSFAFEHRSLALPLIRSGKVGVFAVSAAARSTLC